MSLWQSIETAPMDGTRVLLAFARLDRNVLIGKYFCREEFDFGKSKGKRQGWASETMIDAFIYAEPINWMPLPQYTPEMKNVA